MDLQGLLAMPGRRDGLAMLNPRPRNRFCARLCLFEEQADMRSRVQLADRSKAAPSRLYDEDFALWVDEQVAALRAGGMAALDVANLVAELEGLTKRDVRALGSQLERIMVHMLKRRYAPERASRSWADSIENGREEIADILEQSPSLRRTLPGPMSKHYPRAVAQAARDRGLVAQTFPAEPPFTLDEVLLDAEPGAARARPERP
jgi:Domain of unknown function DUF29